MHPFLPVPECAVCPEFGGGLLKENGGMVAEFTDQGITLYNDINYAVK